MEFAEFLVLARELRKAQKLYFRTRQMSDLNRAKDAESLVDKAIKQLESEHEDTPQALFKG